MTSISNSKVFNNNDFFIFIKIYVSTFKYYLKVIITYYILLLSYNI